MRDSGTEVARFVHVWKREAGTVLFPENDDMSQYIAKVALPIRRPAPEVFNAFVEPSILVRFWLQSASGPLSEGATVEWHFMVPGAADTVTVLEFQLNRRLVLRWSDASSVSLDFTEYSAGETLVTIATSSFKQDETETIVGATEGYSLVLCDLKTLLESGRSANLVKDKAELISRSQAPCSDA